MYCPNCGASDQTPGGTCGVCGHALRSNPGGALSGVQNTATPTPWDSGAQAPSGGVSPGSSPTQGADPWSNAAPAAYPPAYESPAGQPPGYPTSQGDQLAAPPPKKRGKAAILIAGAAVVVVALITVAVMAINGFFSPTTYVLRCAAETVAEMEAEQEKALETLGLDAALALPSTGPAQQEVTVTAQMEDMYQAFGIQADIQSDLPNQELRTDISLQQDGLTMMQFGFDAQDDLIAFRAPSLFSGSYGLHTETLGADIGGTPFEELLGIDIDPAASFNLFDALNPSGANVMVSESGRQALQQLGADAVGKIDTQKKGGATVAVGSARLECRRYDLSLPLAEAQRLLRGAGEILAADDVYLEYMLAQQSGAALATNTSARQNRTSMSADIRDAFNQMADMFVSDITAQVYIASDRVRRTDIQFTIEENGSDVPVELALEIGGDKHLSDLFSLNLRADALTLYYQSSGNHVPVDGLWNSQVELGLSGFQGSSYSVQFTGDMAFDSTAASDNFSARFTLGGTITGTLEAEGTITANRAAATLDAHFDRLHIDIEGDAMDFEAHYMVSPLHDDFEPLTPTLLTDMTQSGLDNLMNEISTSIVGLMLL